MEEEGQQSLECIQANQIFPRKPPVLEEDDLQVPFPELHGEFTEYVGRAEDAVIAMSSYRLHIKFKESVVNTSSHDPETSSFQSSTQSCLFLNYCWSGPQGIKWVKCRILSGIRSKVCKKNACKLHLQ